MSDDPFNDPRAKVELPCDNRLLSDFARDIGAAVSKRANIFTRSGFVFVPNAQGDGLALMTPEQFRTWCEDHVVCFRWRKLESGDKAMQFGRTMSLSDAAGVLAAPQFQSQLKPIERFNCVRMPVARNDGWIELLPEGYDEQARTFTAKSNVAIVDKMPIADAKQIIDELLGEFLFADAGRSKAVAVSAMLTVFGVGILPKKSLRPCFIFIGNAEGCGKTLLTKCATVPVLGSSPSGSQPKDGEEMTKVLLTAVIEAKPALLFDNIRGRIASESLEGFLTSQNWTGRVLGGSKTFTGENQTIVFITGNGCTVSPDMRRRSLFCELFLEAERAEDRQFKQALEVPELIERRSEILSALWGLIQDWHQSMEPKPSRGHSSFPEWANIIGGIVEHAGFGCPLETPNIDAAADVDGQDMRTLVAAMADGALLKVCDFDELVTTARREGVFDRILTGELDAKAKAKLGYLFRSYDRRLVGGFRFSLIGKGRDRRFQVEKVTQ